MGRQRSGRRTDYNWNGLIAGGTQSAATTAIAEIFVSLLSLTVYRVRGEILCSIDGPVDGDKIMVAAGIIVVTEEQLAAGSGSIANPADASDLNDRWLWHGFLPMIAQASGDDRTVAARLTIDSKAMRRMKPAESLIFKVGALSLAGTPAYDWNVGIRCLVGS